MTASMLAPSGTLFRISGRIAELATDDRRALFNRSSAGDDDLRTVVAGILRTVREDGDAALRRLAEQFDGVRLETIEVPKEQCERALGALDPKLRKTMERARANIATVHRAFHPRSTEVTPEPGIIIGRRPDPINRVGVYAPGGRAAYPSSVLMGAVAARTAGVGEVLVCSPPGANGLPHSSVLAAAALAEADRVFAIGGAGAIAAMTWGTESVPRVDRIVGPGNAYVAEAKSQVAAFTLTDAPAGPSELLVIADDDASAEGIARELLAQAEHDPRAAVVVVCFSAARAETISGVVERLLPEYERSVIIRASLARSGAMLIAGSRDEAIDFANTYAPEHLLLAIAEADQQAALARIRNAGTVLLGECSSVAFGDYMTGANHVLPTGGFARSHSGLSPNDFVRWTTYQRVTRETARTLAADVALFAEAEGLPGHAAAANRWRGA